MLSVNIHNVVFIAVVSLLAYAGTKAGLSAAGISTSWL